MFPDTMFPEIYFWGSAFFLMMAFETARQRRADKGCGIFFTAFYLVVELFWLLGSVKMLYLGGL